MLLALEVIAVVLVGVAMALSLAHALELPGKMRLGREPYLAVQTIYYPGFTIGGGVGEAGGLLATVALLLAGPDGTRFWLILAAIAALAMVQAVFWTMTQPVNKLWLRNTRLDPAAERFFSIGAQAAGADEGEGEVADWKALRDRWEKSHVIRAVFAMAAFVLLVVAVAL
jgi:hypothetical protein